MIEGPLQKAYIEPVEGSKGKVEFMFNPSKYRVSRSISWQPGKQKGVDVPEMEFVRGEGRTLSLELFVDTYESGGNAQDFVKKLEALTEVDPANEKNDKKRRPPQVRFGWGAQPPQFKAVIKSLSVTYTLFHSDGRPARATVTVDLQEVKDALGPQNPTSGGEPGRRSHMVLPGETLDIIAYQELGDARHWRHIAEINGLDNPFAIRPGQSLVVTPVG
jgi:hypothetical protein